MRARDVGARNLELELGGPGRGGEGLVEMISGLSYEEEVDEVVVRNGRWDGACCLGGEVGSGQALQGISLESTEMEEAECTR